MTAATAQKSTAATAATPATDYSKFVPQGFKKASNDVVGYWDQKTDPVIDFVPRDVTLVDSSQDARKPSALITGELMRDMKLVNSDKEVIDGKKGDLIGVWYAHGMSVIADLAGVRIVMWQQGEKRIKGRPAGQSPMKLYEVNYDPKAKRAKLNLVADRRDESKDVATVFAPVSVTGGDPAPF